jgi:hypothetical protein
MIATVDFVEAYMTDYWTNKLVFDLQGPHGKDQWTNHRAEVIARYPVPPKIEQALLNDDIGVLIPVINPYLMRFFLLMLGYDDAKSIEVLESFQTDEERKRVNG